MKTEVIKRKKRKNKKKKKKWKNKRFVPFKKWRKQQNDLKKEKRSTQRGKFNDNNDEGEYIESRPSPENEYELQKSYHEWYKKKHPYAPSNGCPYVNMRSPAARTKVLKKGYLTGLPDYVEYDPRAFIGEDENEIKIRIVPAKFIEFKTPKGTGKLRQCQKRVGSALRRRGYMVLTSNDFEESKTSTTKYRNGIPLYNGIITINKKTHKITFPKPPRKVKLPIPLIRKSKKIKKNQYSRKKKRTGRSSVVL